MSNEFDKSIGLNLFLLRLSGVIPRGRAFVARSVLAAVAFFCLSIYTISYTYEFATHGAYLTTALESVAMILSVVGGQLRFTILLLFRGRCQRMLDVCEVLWSALNPREKDIVRSYSRKTRRLTCWYLSSCCFTIFFYGIAALFASWTLNEPADSGTKNLSNVSSRIMRDNDRHLPYAFVVEIKETPWYEIAYTFQLLTMAHVGLTCVGTDTIGPLFALIACGHLDVIKARLEADDGSVTTVEIASREQVDSLRVCLTHHRILLEFCEEIERLTNALFLTQLIGSTYNISLVGFKLVGVSKAEDPASIALQAKLSLAFGENGSIKIGVSKLIFLKLSIAFLYGTFANPEIQKNVKPSIDGQDDPDKYKFITQLAIAVTQLFLCNWPADLLHSKSEAIGRSAYFSPWYRYPSWLRKPTSLILTRAQRPARLTAGKFVVLSLETFASMISSAASFFALVRSMN